jgi:hypothetical protein
MALTEQALGCMVHSRASAWLPPLRPMFGLAAAGCVLAQHQLR